MRKMKQEKKMYHGREKEKEKPKTSVYILK